MYRSQQLLSLRLLILLMVTAAVFLLISNRVEASVPAAAPTAHRVIAGESLWDIASSMRVTRDVRAVIADIRELNSLLTSTLHPGQVLLLPAA